MNHKELLVGNWQLLSMVNEHEDGEHYYPFSKNVKGLLIYTADGYMSVQLGKADRDNFKSDDFRHGTHSEIFHAFNHFIAYFGKYELDSDRNQIIHDIDLSMYPNWSGTKVRRYYRIEKNILTLKATPIEFKDMFYTPTLNWIKI